MDVHPANAAAANSLGELFPLQVAATLESDDSGMDWLSVYMEECFSSSSSFSNPVSGKPPPIMANQGAGNPKLLPASSSNGGQRKRSLTSVLGEDYDQQYIIPLFIEPPLLPMDQKHWMAESELILPKKEKDQELCQQQEQEYKKVSLIILKKEKDEELCQQQEQEYKEVSLILPKKEEDQELCQQQEQEYKEVKCEEDALMQSCQELPLKRCSNCLSCQTSLWRHGLGLSGHKMLCNACSLKVKPENGFTTISGKQCGQGTNKKQEQGKRRDKKKMMKREDASERELPVRACTHCMSSKTPQWRAGPMGPKTLCNACGVRYKSGRLLPEYRPANSPTFVSHIHSNSHKKVLQLRQADGHK